MNGVERPVTRGTHRLARSPERAEKAAGRTPDPTFLMGWPRRVPQRAWVKGCLFAEFAAAVEAGDLHEPHRLVGPVTPATRKTSRRPRDPRPEGGATPNENDERHR